MGMTVPMKVRAAVLARSGSRCERCGIRKEIGLHMSHRQARGMGGALSRKVVEHYRLSNINALCAKCHLHFVEREISHAEDEGWRVRRGESPEDIPMKMWFGWTYLTNDGRYESSRPGHGAGSSPTPHEEQGGEEDAEAHAPPRTR